jgi:hypothetical protein
MNEQHVLWIICAGALVQSWRGLVSWRQVGAAGLLALAALVAAWAWTESAGRAFDGPVLWFLLYGFACAAVFRARMTPRISPAAVLHHVIAAAWAVAAAWPRDTLPMPPWFAVALAAPPAALAAVVVTGGLHLRALRVMAYAAFLASFATFALTANPLDGVVEAYRASGYSLRLVVEAFVAGAALLITLGVVVQLMLVVSPGGGALRTAVFDAVLDPRANERHWRWLSRRLRGTGIDAIGWGLLAAHAGTALVTLSAGRPAPSAVVGTSLIAWAWAIEPWEAWRWRSR